MPLSADEPLEAGVVDGLLEAGIRAVGAIRDAAHIEWGKAWSAELVSRTCPEIMPFHRPVRDETALAAAMNKFESTGMLVVVNPQGLTDGMGVKVTGPHLDT